MTKAIKELIIWDNFREGNKDALEVIYEDNYTPLYYYGMKFTKDKDLVKDVIQELFIELIDSGEKLARTDNIRAYLLKALRYKLFFLLTKKMKMKSDCSANAEFNLVESIENQLIREEVEQKTQILIISAIKKLTSKQQEVIYLRFYNDMPFQDIADLFDTKIQTVRNLISRAITQLKEDFERQNISREMIFLVLNLQV